MKRQIHPEQMKACRSAVLSALQWVKRLALANVRTAVAWVSSRRERPAPKPDFRSGASAQPAGGAELEASHERDAHADCSTDRDDFQARMIAMCIGCAVSFIRDFTDDPERRKRIARNMGRSMVEAVNSPVLGTNDAAE